MIQKILPLSAAALLALSACSSDSSSTSPSTPSGNSEATCSAKKLSSNTVEMIFGVPGAYSTTITTTLKGDKAESTIYTKYSSSAPAEAIRKECEDNKQEAAEDYGDNASVTCTDRSITIKSIDDAEGLTIDKLYEKAVGECAVFREMYDDDDNDKEKDQHESGPVVSNPDINDTHSSGTIDENSNGKATCIVNQNTETTFEMTISDADTATMKIFAEYKGGILSESSTVIFNENIPDSYIQQECEEAKQEALEDGDGTTVTCEGNVIKQEISMDSPINPLYLMTGMLIESCNEIQETGIIPDDEF